MICCCVDREDAAEHVEPLRQVAVLGLFGGAHWAERSTQDPGYAIVSHEAVQRTGGGVDTFTVDITRGDLEMWGLRLECCAAGLLVAEVVSGAVERYNNGVSGLDAAGARKIQMYDIIVEANGERAQGLIWRQLKEEAAMAFEVVRPRLLTVNLKKGHLPLGVLLSHPVSGHGKTLGVAEICDGLVKDYNASAEADAQVMVGDVIVSVNGQMGSSKNMIELLQVDSDVELTLLRVQH